MKIMLKNFAISLVIAGLAGFGATACRSNVSDRDGQNIAANQNTSGAGAAGNAVSDDQTPAPAPTAAAVATLGEDARPVLAKRENMTLADRTAFLRAIGFNGYAESSARFLPTIQGRTANCEICGNAGMLFHEIGDGKYLVEIFASEGAREATSVFALYQETAVGKAMAKPLEFDDFGKSDGKVSRTVNRELVGHPEFDAKNKILTVTAYGRGIGGCGSQSKYRFTDNRAEIIEARSQECTDADVKVEDWAKIPVEEYKKMNLPDANFASMKPAHAAILKAWLAGRDDEMRLANYEYDSISSQNYLKQDAPERSPFYAFGDFNGNGIEDFAVILDRPNAYYDKVTKRTPNALAVFEVSASNNGENPRPAFFTDTIDSLFVIHPFEKYTPSKEYLSIGSYPSDDGFYLAPKGNSYQAKPLLD